VPAGLDASFGVSSGSTLSGADCCRKTARARVGISFCKPSRSTASSTPAVNGDCTAIGSSTARWPTCSAAIAEAPEREAQEVVDLFKDYGGSCKTYTVTDARRHRSEERRHLARLLLRFCKSLYGVSADEAAPVVAALRREPKAWRNFMMRFELGLEAPDPRRGLRSAFTIAGSYIVGGMIPLLPYMLAANAHQALLISIAVTLLALTVFGFVKGHFTGVSKIKSAWQTALVGSPAAGVAFVIAKAIS